MCVFVCVIFFLRLTIIILPLSLQLSSHPSSLIRFLLLSKLELNLFFLLFFMTIQISLVVLNVALVVTVCMNF